MGSNFSFSLLICSTSHVTDSHIHFSTWDAWPERALEYSNCPLGVFTLVTPQIQTSVSPLKLLPLSPSPVFLILGKAGGCSCISQCPSHGLDQNPFLRGHCRFLQLPALHPSSTPHHCQSEHPKSTDRATSLPILKLEMSFQRQIQNSQLGIAVPSEESGSRLNPVCRPLGPTTGRFKLLPGGQCWGSCPSHNQPTVILPRE